jgi:hypothetical protein
MAASLTPAPSMHPSTTAGIAVAAFSQLKHVPDHAPVLDSTAGATHPFESAKALRFAISSAAGAIPPVKVFIRAEDASIGPYCNNQISLAERAPAASEEEFTKFVVPFEEFGCSSPNTAARLEFQNAGNDTVQFCLDDVVIEY